MPDVKISPASIVIALAMILILGAFGWLTFGPKPVPPPPPVLPPPVPVPQIPPIGFHNGPAVRIAMVYGFLSIVSLVVFGTLGAAAPFLVPVWLVAGGFLSVLAYRRRTGQRLSWLHGAHLGWICGIFGFAMQLLVVFVPGRLQDARSGPLHAGVILELLMASESDR